MVALLWTLLTMPVNDTSPLVIDFVGLHVSEALKQELTFTSPSSRQGYRMGRETSVSIEGLQINYQMAPLDRSSLS